MNISVSMQLPNAFTCGHKEKNPCTAAFVSGKAQESAVLRSAMQPAIDQGCRNRASPCLVKFTAHIRVGSPEANAVASFGIPSGKPEANAATETKRSGKQSTCENAATRYPHPNVQWLSVPLTKKTTFSAIRIET